MQLVFTRARIRLGKTSEHNLMNDGLEYLRIPHVAT
jgi:hypothetical protein